MQNSKAIAKNSEVLSDEMSSDGFDQMQKKMTITKKMAESGSNLPIEARIELLEGLRIKEAEKVFGYTPDDFAIYKRLNKIDMSGVRKSLSMPLGYDSDDYDRPRDATDDTDATVIECFESFLNSLVIR